MSFLLPALALVLVASFAMLWHEAKRAPEGHEEEDGFHFGHGEKDFSGYVQATDGEDHEPSFADAGFPHPVS